MNDLFQCKCPHCGQDMPDASDTPFSAFWASVPHKIGKANAEKAWRKLGKVEREQAASMVVAFYGWFAKTYPGASPLHPATYLNGKRWQDEGVAPRNDISHTQVEAQLLKALNSSIPSVREHAKRMAERHGLQIGGNV